MLTIKFSAYLAVLLAALCISFAQVPFGVNPPSITGFDRASTISKTPSWVMKSSAPNTPLVVDGSGSQPLLLETFASNFMKGLRSDQKLLNSFTLGQLTADEASKLLYNYVFASHSSVGAPNPEFYAHMVADALKLNFAYVKPVSLLTAYAYSVAKHLNMNKILTAEKVLGLSQSYFDLMKTGLNSVADTTPLKGVAIGLINFLNSVGLYTRKTAGAFAQTFANELNNLRSY